MVVLELRPVHGHVDAVRVGPQPQVLVVVRVVHSVVKLLVDLREAERKRRYFEFQQYIVSKSILLTQSSY